MKPNPFVALNHFTVPEGIGLFPQQVSARVRRRYGTEIGRLHQPGWDKFLRGIRLALTARPVPTYEQLDLAFHPAGAPPARNLAHQQQHPEGRRRGTALIAC